MRHTTSLMIHTFDVTCPLLIDSKHRLNPHCTSTRSVRCRGKGTEWNFSTSRKKNMNHNQVKTPVPTHWACQDCLSIQPMTQATSHHHRQCQNQAPNIDHISASFVCVCVVCCAGINIGRQPDAMATRPKSRPKHARVPPPTRPVFPVPSDAPGLY